FSTDDMVKLAQEREATPDPLTAIAIGVDVAWKGSNKTGCLARQGPCLIAKEVHSMMQIDESARALMVFVDILRMRFPGVRLKAYIDTIGYGAGVHDICKTAGYPVETVNSALPAMGPHRDRFANRRMELWDMMKNWVCREGCLGPDEDTLVNQLTAPSAGLTPKGQLILEGKDAMLARGVVSPDEADALSYTFAGQGFVIEGLNLARGMDGLQRTNPLLKLDAGMRRIFAGDHDGTNVHPAFQNR